jgi:APA family basic amino acid/polyamine antiporter
VASARLVLLSVFTAVVPDIFSAGAQLYWLLTRGRETHRAHLVRNCGVSALALAFSFWSLAGSGYQAVPRRVLPAAGAADLRLAHGRAR